MLFQPTNIFPSDSMGLGGGTVDAEKPLEISWQINGNSPMTAFSIGIYKNDFQSTLVYSTGKLTENCPFEGKDRLGNYKFFSYKIESPKQAGMVNGEEYKLIITQWWSESESITQQSASVFITRTTPSLSIDEIPSPLAANKYLFGATYYQEQGDPLNWVRWQIAEADNTDEPFYDSQYIYGVSLLQTEYDGFFTGTDYSVRCRAQTANGIEADTGWIDFHVEYETISITGAIKASCAKGRSAVALSWPGIYSIIGKTTGEVELDENSGEIEIGPDSNIVWDNVDGKDMLFGDPWTLIFKTAVYDSDVRIMKLSTVPGAIRFKYLSDRKTLSITRGNFTLAELPDGSVEKGSIVSVIFTPERMYARITGLQGALAPSEALTPSSTLVPSSGAVSTSRYMCDLDYVQGGITAIETDGRQKIEYIEILSGEPKNETIEAVYETDTYVPEHVDEDLFLAYKSLNAGTSNSIDGIIAGYSVYRRKKDSGILVHISDTESTVLLDYAAANEQGPYIYYAFPYTETSFATQPFVSNEISPVRWDWVILECAEIEEGYYCLLEEYRFAYNVSSGTTSNNNSPNVLRNFTKFPTVQPDSAEYKSGTLSGLIGKIEMNEDGKIAYRDTIEQRDKIFALATSQNTLFLKNRKGDLIQIKTSGAITASTADNLREQAQTVSIPWIEVGDSENVSIVSWE